MLNEREREAIAHYERCARRGECNLYPIWPDVLMQRTFAELPNRPAILDVGSGCGRFTTVLPVLGIEKNAYLGIDPSRAQVRLARKLHPKYRFEVGNIYELGVAYPKQFDGFACFAMLMHIPRRRLPRALRSLRASLKPSSVGMISTPLGTKDVPSLGGIVVTLWETETLEQRFGEAGFVANLFSPDGVMIVGSVRAV